AEADKAGRALAAMQTSFKPVGKRALDPGLVALDEAARRGMLAGMEVRRPALSRSGFYVSGAGAVLTTTDVLQNCTRLTIDRDIEADLTFRDDALGLALLTPHTPLAPRQIAAFAAQPARIGSEIAIAGYSYEDALPSATLTFGAMEDTKGLAGEPGLNRLSVAALPGDAGGPVINASGSVLGMLLPRRPNDGRVLPDEVAFATSGAVIAARLTEGGLAPQMDGRGGAMAPEDLTDLATRMTVLVSCWN
ncbi:MAG: serine protease, partial [Paracoccaceae bacterium]|nr:serine protease [Paracoccaceae bacterium]